jgi:hypothetical protein
MVAQCLGGQESGWKHFITEYLPFAMAVLERHAPEAAARRQDLLGEVLLRARANDADFFRRYSGHSEREFLLHLREHALLAAALQENAPEIPLEWDVFEKALAEFTILERQAVWMFVLCPGGRDAGKMMRLEPKSIEGIITRAQEALRRNCDRWNPEMLAANRHLLAGAARARSLKDCAAPRLFLRLLDGQITWRGRAEIEHHLAVCWRCVDLLCRLREVAFLMRQTRPLPAAEAESCCKLLGLRAGRASGLRRLLGRA